jgi:tRNA wybutosine-synthesizing protein 4
MSLSWKCVSRAAILRKLLTDASYQTNNSCIVSKRSVERIYHKEDDGFLRYFVKKFQRRSPLINRGYWLRMRAIEHVVKTFLEETEGKKRTVVNLGCG